MEIISASISAILQKIFDDKISDLIAQGKDAAAHRGFLKKLTEWCEAFILEHETEAVAGEGFSRYLQYHRPIENIFEYIKNPKDVAEEKFLEGLILRAEECVFENIQRKVADNSVSDFIVSVFSQVKGFYIGKIKTEDISLNYHIRQIMLKNSENEIGVKPPPVIQKKFYSYDEKLIARKVIPFKELHETFAFRYNKKGMSDLADVCLSEKKVVLLGEAGCGKTVEIHQLAGAVC
ncbi:MAG: hypothetical protein IJX55_06805, partial [Clostridia bacterium]|nr:hypothetical protein [Clostridia bacterium]